MKSFIAPLSVEDCKQRLIELNKVGWFGLTTKVKFVQFDASTWEYKIWKTQRSTLFSNHETTLVGMRGKLMTRDGISAHVTGQFYTGQFYKFLFCVYALCCVLILISNKPGSLFFVTWLLGLMGFGWLLVFYWRNKLEGIIERKLMGIEKGKKKKAR
ncbi:MAG: hypothetical protein R3E39_14135 [Anaerolineae bacterium]